MMHAKAILSKAVKRDYGSEDLFPLDATILFLS
jgi:hypothetical protein